MTDTDLDEKQYMEMFKVDSQLSQNDVPSYYILWKKKTRTTQTTNINYIAKKTKIVSSIASAFRDTLAESVSNIELGQFINYEDGDGQDSQTILIEDIQNVPFASDAISSIESTHEELNLTALKRVEAPIFAIKFKSGLYAFGKVEKFDLLKRSESKWSLRLNDEAKFESINDEFLLMIPKKLPVVLFQNKFVIFDDNAFQSMFAYHEKIMQTIVQEKAKLGNFLTDEDQMVEYLGKDYRKAKKIYLALKTGYLNGKTTQDILDYANEYSLDVKSDGNGKISLANSNKWHVVHALSERYYTGRFSNFHLEATSSRRLK